MAEERFDKESAPSTKPAAEINTRDLIALFGEIAGRAASYDTKEMHDRFWEIRRELEAREHLFARSADESISEQDIAELKRLRAMFAAATEVQGDDEVLKYVTSGNAIPVTRCTVSADLIRQLVGTRSAREEIVMPAEPTGAMLGLIAGEYDEPVRMNRQQAATVYHAIRALCRRTSDRKVSE